MRSSAIRELLKLTEELEIISFAGGLPGPEVFPAKDFRSACMHVLEEHGPEALQYGTTEGFTPLRQMIARHAKRYGITAEPENILITCGSQQALDLIGKVFIDPGDEIVVERPTYLGALQAWNAYEANYHAVPMDADGIKMDELEQALAAGGKFVYVMPNFQNPTGVTLSLERRKKLVDLTSRYRVPLVEDDPYGQLRYEGKHLPPLFALNGLDVIYLSTFSKILSPGLRLGWIVAPSEIIRRLVQAKQGTDLHTSTLIQLVVYEVAHGGFLDRQVRSIRVVYRERRDAMVSAMKKYFPSGVTWTEPHGGLFLWVTLPESFDSAEVLREALKEKVAFVPGTSFYPDGSGANTMRLNFSYSKATIIEEGIRRLGKVLRAMMVQTKPVALPLGTQSKRSR